MWAVRSLCLVSLHLGQPSTELILLLPPDSGKVVTPRVLPKGRARLCMLDLLVSWVVPFVITLGAALLVNFAVQIVLYERVDSALLQRERRRLGVQATTPPSPAASSSSSSSSYLSNLLLLESTPTSSDDDRLSLRNRKMEPFGTDFAPVDEVAPSSSSSSSGNAGLNWTHGFAIEVGSCAIQGRRPYMEDRRTIIEDLREMASKEDPSSSASKMGDRCSFFAVFDGHGGQLASTFASGVLHKNLVKSAHFPDNPILALEEACALTDREFAEKYQTATAQDGTTACMVLIIGRRLYVANVGDSRAVLCRRGSCLPAPPFLFTSFCFFIIKE